jgi:hypothetical protein
MASLLPVSFRSSPLPYNWSGTPNDFLSALTARLYIESEQQIALINSGSVAPTSDVGPWLKDGVEWYVWNPISGTYVPQTITALAAFDTIPFRGNSSGAQSMAFATDGAASLDIDLTEEFDSGGNFAGSIFTVPVDGYYHFDAKVGLACTAGAPVSNTTIIYLKRNGFQLSKETVFYPTEDLVGRTLSISSNLELAAGDEIKVGVSVSVAGGTFPATWSVTQNDTWFSGFKIKTK